MEYIVQNVFLFPFLRDISSCSFVKVNGSFGRTFGLQLLGQRIRKARNQHEVLGWPSAATRCYIPDRTTAMRTTNPTFLFPKWKYAGLLPNSYKTAYRLTVVPDSSAVQQPAYAWRPRNFVRFPIGKDQSLLHSVQTGCGSQSVSSPQRTDRLWVPIGHLSTACRPAMGPIGLFSTACRPTVGPKHSRIKWVTELFPRTKAPFGLKLTTHAHLVSKMITRGASPPLLYMYSWRGG